MDINSKETSQIETVEINNVLDIVPTLKAE